MDLDEGSLFIDDDDNSLLMEEVMAHLNNTVAAVNGNSHNHEVIDLNTSSPTYFPPDSPILLAALDATERAAIRAFHQSVDQQYPRRNHPSGQQQPNEEPGVIDLTAEPDSPVAVQPSRPMQPGRNPRRTNSQRTSRPSLSRSDGTLSSSQTGTMAQQTYIDLTAEDDDHPTRSTRSGRRQAASTFQFAADTTAESTRHNRHLPSPARRVGDTLFRVNFLPPTAAPEGYARDSLGFRRRMVGLLGVGGLEEIMFLNAPHRDGARVPLHQLPLERPSPPKPPVEPTPPTRPGFTRDTCAEPEDDAPVVVCPCCNEPLEYDPEAPAVVSKGTSKRKRAPGEHHFWALKRCGHVYCADCFENRRRTSRNSGAGFPVIQNWRNNTEIQCAVEGCETRPGAKTEWVGIFL